MFFHFWFISTCGRKYSATCERFLKLNIKALLHFSCRDASSGKIFKYFTSLRVAFDIFLGYEEKTHTLEKITLLLMRIFHLGCMICFNYCKPLNIEGRKLPFWKVVIRILKFITFHKSVAMNLCLILSFPLKAF